MVVSSCVRVQDHLRYVYRSECASLSVKDLIFFLAGEELKFSPIWPFLPNPIIYTVPLGNSASVWITPNGAWVFGSSTWPCVLWQWVARSHMVAVKWTQD